MRKNIDISGTTLTKLKMISIFENLSVKRLMEKAIEFFVKYKEQEKFDSLTDDEKEDIGLFLLMQQSDMNDTVEEEKIMSLLDD